MKYNKVINLFLGTIMFMFGFLKFFNPFESWYCVQIGASELGQASYALGIAGELTVGLAFLALIRFRERFSFEFYSLLSAFASVAVIIMMTTATYVHLHPNVPAEVLPLKIKPPFIPLFFMAVAVVNLIILSKQYKFSKS